MRKDNSYKTAGFKARLRSESQTEQKIRERAYELYVTRGRQNGGADEDWLRAETEIIGANKGGAA
jgi:hypothetical protein